MFTGHPIHAALSHPGRVRSHNEDAWAVDVASGLYVICDGMGGSPGGEVASQLACERFLNVLTAPRNSPSGSRRIPANTLSNDPQHNPQTRLHAAILAANQAVLEEAAAVPALHGMGTTLIGLLHTAPNFVERRAVPRSTLLRNSGPPSLFLANVGDSRCYRLRKGALHQLSHDHSYVNEQLRAGRITPEQAAFSPMRNYLTRAVGVHSHVEPDIQSYRPEPNDLYLLASDGLTGELTDAEIAAILTREVPSITVAPNNLKLPLDLQIACQTLVHAANERGGRDNVSVLLLAFPPL